MLGRLQHRGTLATMTPTAQRSKFAPKTCLAGYSTVVAVYILLAFVTRDWLPPVALLGQFRPLLLLACGPLFLIAAILNQRKTAAVLALTCGLGLAQYHKPLAQLGGWSQHDEQSARGPAFVVETWNLGARRSTNGDVIAHLESSPAHIIALQEVSHKHESALRQRLGELYPHQAYRGQGRNSLALLSRVPLVNVQWHEPSSGKPWLTADVKHEGHSIHVTTVHPSAWSSVLSRWSSDRPVLEEIAASFEGQQHSVLLGDFNATPSSGEYALLVRARWADAFAQAGHGFGFTFPVFLRYRGLPSPPLVRIDQIWTHGRWHATSCRVGPSSSSDHLPLRARLVFDSVWFK